MGIALLNLIKLFSKIPEEKLDNFYHLEYSDTKTHGETDIGVWLKRIS